MTRETWRKFGVHAGLWTLAVFAAEAAIYYMGNTPDSFGNVVLLNVLGWTVTWVILRIKPSYYDSSREKRAKQPN